MNPHFFFASAFFALASAAATQAPIAGGASHDRVRFTLPFEAALKKARAENRLLLLKPVYGGVDELGAKDYCAGTW